MRAFIAIGFLLVLAATWDSASSCRIVRHVLFARRLLRRCKWKWGPCSRTCGGGKQYPYKTRRQGWLRRCHMPTQGRKCNTHCCPADGYWKPLAVPWSRCSASCGRIGFQTRPRACIGPYCGGKPCRGNGYEMRRCYNGRCCAWSLWGSWSKCTLTCDSGNQHRLRIHKYGVSGSKICPSGASHENRVCNSGCCPEDCSWSKWGAWGNCSVACDWGIQHRKRGELAVDTCGGNSCEGAPIENRDCYAGCCPVDCKWSDWGEWSHCSRSCGSGIKRRHRPKAMLAKCGGSKCTGESYETGTCNEHCCASDCKWGNWGHWSECSKPCDLGELTRYRNVSNEASCGGLACRGESFDTEHCNAFCCPEHCDWDEWSDWSECSTTCGIGEQTRERSVQIHQDCGVKRCVEPHHDVKNCTLGCCPVDCEVSPWTEWSECSASCGVGGLKSRYKNITTPAECGGRECKYHMLETETCNRFCFHNGTLNEKSCGCPDGWEGACCEDDTDECLFVDCPTNSACFNTYGSYECVCNHNFTKENGQCIPTTACHTGEHDCHDYAQCISVEYLYECKCEPGFSGNGTFCEDIDECELEKFTMEKIVEEVGSGQEDLVVMARAAGGLSPLCHADAICKNTFGSYECECSSGYTGDGSVCKDIDECSLQQVMNENEDGVLEYDPGLSTAACHENASCANEPGSYYCTCKDGYYGDGFLCNELDECESFPCKNSGECVDLLNLFRCNCKEGFTGLTCENDIDECKSENHGCLSVNEECVNNEGSYTCSCVKGLTKINGICQEMMPEDEA